MLGGAYSGLGEAEGDEGGGGGSLSFCWVEEEEVVVVMDWGLED